MGVVLVIPDLSHKQINIRTVPYTIMKALILNSTNLPSCTSDPDNKHVDNVSGFFKNLLRGQTFLIIRINSHNMYGEHNINKNP